MQILSGNTAEEFIGSIKEIMLPHSKDNSKNLYICHGGVTPISKDLVSSVLSNELLLHLTKRGI